MSLKWQKTKECKKVCVGSAARRISVMPTKRVRTQEVKDKEGKEVQNGLWKRACSMSTGLSRFRRVECWRDYETVRICEEGDANRRGSERCHVRPGVLVPSQRALPRLSSTTQRRQWVFPLHRPTLRGSRHRVFTSRLVCFDVLPASPSGTHLERHDHDFPI